LASLRLVAHAFFHRFITRALLSWRQFLDAESKDNGRNLSGTTPRAVLRNGRARYCNPTYRRWRMNGMYWMSGSLALLLFVYLLYALIKAEKF
jgi:K+-transporting ATPase KdpF subunit